MVIYDIYYREKGNLKSEVKKRSFTAHTREGALNIAKGTLPSNTTIIKVEKIG